MTGRRGLTARMRLTVFYGGLLVATDAVVLGLIYAFMRFVPTYRIGEADVSTVGDAGALTPVAVASPAPTLTAATTAPGNSPLVISSTEQMLGALLVTSLVVLVVLAVVGTGLGHVMAGRALRPLVAINAAARRAASGSLQHRIALPGPRDEFTDLSDTFDDMLDRLEGSFASRERFAANASHELTSPLAAAKTMIEVSLARPETEPEAWRALVARLGELNDRSIGTVESLLDLATIDAQDIRRDPVDLAVVVTEAVEALRGEAWPRGIHVTARVGAARTTGDPVLVRRLVANLLTNAVQHNEDGGWVDVDLVSPPAGDRARLRVENTGTPIAPESVRTLLEPFARGAGRTSGPGHGLGLALVDRIVAVHGGTLTLEPRPGGGLVVLVDLPA
ncbi:sensor histidine kinase [Cellulomonas hominis]